MRPSPITITDRCGPGRVIGATFNNTSARAKPRRRSKHRCRSSRSDFAPATYRAFISNMRRSAVTLGSRLFSGPTRWSGRDLAFGRFLVAAATPIDDTAWNEECSGGRILSGYRDAEPYRRSYLPYGVISPSGCGSVCNRIIQRFILPELQLMSLDCVGVRKA